MSREHPAAVPEIKTHGRESTFWDAAVAKAMSERSVVVVDSLPNWTPPLPGISKLHQDNRSTTTTEIIFSDVLSMPQGGQWPEPPTKAVVLPITAGDLSIGVMIAGVNPRRVRLNKI